jgi:hypothetical protein
VFDWLGRQIHKAGQAVGLYPTGTIETRSGGTTTYDPERPTPRPAEPEPTSGGFRALTWAELLARHGTLTGQSASIADFERRGFTDPAQVAVGPGIVQYHADKFTPPGPGLWDRFAGLFQSPGGLLRLGIAIGVIYLLVQWTGMAKGMFK